MEMQRSASSTKSKLSAGKVGVDWLTGTDDGMVVMEAALYSRAIRGGEGDLAYT